MILQFKGNNILIGNYSESTKIENVTHNFVKKESLLIFFFNEERNSKALAGFMIVSELNTCEGHLNDENFIYLYIPTKTVNMLIWILALWFIETSIYLKPRITSNLQPNMKVDEEK